MIADLVIIAIGALVIGWAVGTAVASMRDEVAGDEDKPPDEKSPLWPGM